MLIFHLGILYGHLAPLALNISGVGPYLQTLTILSSIEGQYLGPTPCMLPEYIALFLNFFELSYEPFIRISHST